VNNENQNQEPKAVPAQSENEIIRLRYEKIQKIREAGFNPYQNRFKPKDLTREIRAKFEKSTAEELEKSEQEFEIAGRIVRLNFMGKSNFMVLRDRTGELQVYLNRKDLDEKKQWLLKQLDVGDFVGSSGRLFRTKTGELTIYGKDFILVTKSIRPLPEKWHGLKDVEARYRQRYVDLVSNPKAFEIMRTRAKVVSLLRNFLEQREFVEIETPVLQAVPGGALAKPFVTHHNALDINLYLRIATELYLKRLVVGGFERVYEMGRVFRNEGTSTWHNPEYTMLEFYMAYADFEDLVALNEEMLSGIVNSIHGKTKITWGEKELDFTPPFRRVKMEDAVAEKLKLSSEEIRKGDALRNWLKNHGIELAAGDGWGKALACVFEETVEGTIVSPTVITHFPVEISPLSRRNEADPEITDRFELIVAGKEIANAFSELNDPADQRARFEEQVKARARGDEEAHPIDEDFVRSLEIGMPPTAGEGVGIDRLVMLLTDSPSIRDVIPFPLLRPE
jgi:lysyl-tRNA synthetase, class II